MHATVQQHTTTEGPQAHQEQPESSCLWASMHACSADGWVQVCIQDVTVGRGGLSLHLLPITLLQVCRRQIHGKAVRSSMQPSRQPSRRVQRAAHTVLTAQCMAWLSMLPGQPALICIVCLACQAQGCYVGPESRVLAGAVVGKLQSACGEDIHMKVTVTRSALCSDVDLRCWLSIHGYAVRSIFGFAGYGLWFRCERAGRQLMMVSGGSCLVLIKFLKSSACEVPPYWHCRCLLLTKT